MRRAKLAAMPQPNRQGDARSDASTANPAVKTTPEQSPLTLQISMISGEFQRQVKSIHSDTAKLPNAFDRKRPVTSILGFAGKEDEFWQFDDLKQFDKWRTIVRLLAEKNVFEPFDEKWTALVEESNKSNGIDEFFIIPDVRTVSNALNSIAQVHIQECFLASRLIYSGLLAGSTRRDVFLLSSGHGDAANIELCGSTNPRTTARSAFSRQASWSGI